MPRLKVRILLITAALLAAAAGVLVVVNTMRTPVPSAPGMTSQGGPAGSNSVPSGKSGPGVRAREVLSPEVAELVLARDISFQERLDVAHNLGEELSAVDIAALLKFVEGGVPAGCSAEQWHALFNDILNALRHQKGGSDAVPGLSAALLAIYQGEPDPVLRDYALQHLGSWLAEPGSGAGQERDPARRSEILAAIHEAARQTGEAFSGTALLALVALLEQPGQADGEGARVDQLVLSSALSPATSKQCRISALQLCALRGLSTALPTIRGIAADGSADPNLRLSAIAALGRLGDDSDRPLLVSLAGARGRLAHAAEPALQQIIKR